MKANTYEYPKSSFLGLQKDTAILMDKILSNQNVLKLLYYNTPDALSKEDVMGKQIKEMLQSSQISNVPIIRVDPAQMNYLRLTFDSFTPSEGNSFYRDHIVEIKIICHYDNWRLPDFEIRPYRIAGELDAMLDRQRFSGIGVLNFLYAEENIYNDEFGGITLKYLAVRGNEDKVNPLE